METKATKSPDNTHGVDLARIREAIGPVLSANGVDLVDLEWATDQGGWVLRATIERPGSIDQGGGVTLDDCADVSRGISAVLDADDPITAHYNLEVSSPGLDRPLRTQADFARFVGKLARVKLSRPAPDGQRLLRGTLAEAKEGAIAVIVDGKRIEAPFSDVAEANLVYELATQPKPSQGRKGARGRKSQKGS